MTGFGRSASAIACQCASRPSPRLEVSPMPVIHTSRVTAGLPRSSGGLSQDDADEAGAILDHLVELDARILHLHERDLGLGDLLAIDPDLALADAEAGAGMEEIGGDMHDHARRDEALDLDPVDAGKEGDARPRIEAEHDGAGGVVHGVEEKHAGHDRKMREVALED